MRVAVLIICALALIAIPACSRAQNSTAPGDSALVASLQKLAAANNAEAIYHLGMRYHLGMGLPQDKAKALAAFRKAASLGDPLAAYKLGCYYDGQGEGLIEPDQLVALQHKLVAARAGYTLAQQDVAYLLIRKGDTPGAVDWLKKAATQGNAAALMAYASAHNGAPGVPRDPVVTAAYFRLFLNRIDADDRQRGWLADFESKMTPEQRSAAADIVSRYRATPSPLTIKALSGDRAAMALVAEAR